MSHIIFSTATTSSDRTSVGLALVALVLLGRRDLLGDRPFVRGGTNSLELLEALTLRELLVVVGVSAPTLLELVVTVGVSAPMLLELLMAVGASAPRLLGLLVA